jgi:hypothetical protein
MRAAFRSRSGALRCSGAATTSGSLLTDSQANRVKRLCFLLCCAVQAGCGGIAANASTASPPLNPAAPAGVRPALDHRFVFTCQNGTVFDCLVYTNHGKLLRTLTADVESPLGVVAGKDGLLYVANEFADDILVYSIGGRTLLHELDDGGNVPIDVAVFSDALAVSNQHVLTYFRPGAAKPTRTLHDPNVLQGGGVAFDPNGNCYWSFATNANTSQVDEFVGCKGKPHVIPISPGLPFGMAFDANGNLYYTTYSSGTPGLYRCSGTSACRKLIENFVDPEYINFSGDFKVLWVSDPGNASSGSALYEIDAVSGEVRATITAGLTFYNPPSGVAAAPGPF